MRKSLNGLFIFSVIAISVISISVSALSVTGTILGNESSRVVVDKEGTHAPLHTAVKPTNMSQSEIRVKTQVQRKNMLGTYVTLETQTLPFYSSNLNVAQEQDFETISGVADTRAVWTNISAKGSRLDGQFYINSYSSDH